MKGRLTGDLKLALIGAGEVARSHLTAFGAIPDIEFVGIANRSGRGLAELCREFSIREGCTDWRQMIERTRPDAVLVIASVASLFEIARGCLERSLPCLIEKPPALSSADVATLASLARGNGALAMVGFNRRLSSVVHECWLHAVATGGPRQIHVEVNENVDRIMARGKHPDPVLRRWMMANAIHTIDLVNLFAPGFGIDRVLGPSGQPIERISFLATLQERQGNGCGSIAGHWAAVPHSRICLSMDGLEITLDGIAKATIRDRSARTETITLLGDDTQHAPGFHRQARCFTQCLLAGEPIRRPACTLDDAVHTAAMVEQIETHLGLI